MSSYQQQNTVNQDSQASLPNLNKRLSESKTAQWNSHQSFQPSKVNTQYDNYNYLAKGINLLESERESASTSFNEVNFHCQTNSHNQQNSSGAHQNQSHRASVHSSVKSLPASLSLASKFNFRQLITSPQQNQMIENNLKARVENKENMIDSSYIRTDEDEFGSQVQLLKVRTVGNKKDSESVALKDYQQHIHNLYNQASKESFGLNASEIVPYTNHGANITGDESMMFTNMSVLGQYLKESEVQSQAEQKSFQMNETHLDQSRSTNSRIEMIKKASVKQSFQNNDISQYMEPYQEISKEGSTGLKQFSFSDLKNHHLAPNRTSECFDENFPQYKSAQDTQDLKQVDHPRIISNVNQNCNFPFDNKYSSAGRESVYDSIKKPKLHAPQDSICEKIQILRYDISNLFPEQSQRESTRKNESQSSTRQQRVNAQFQQLVQQTNPSEGFQDIMIGPQMRMSFLHQKEDQSPMGNSSHDLISRTEDRIRRSRAERSASKSAVTDQSTVSRQQTTIPSQPSHSQVDDLAMLRQEVRSLADQLREEKLACTTTSRQKPCCHYSVVTSTPSTQEDEIKALKQELSKFEDRFKNEVGNIQEHYKSYCREVKSKKSQQIDEIQAKLDVAEKRNFDLESHIKELKLKLEFSESDARKNHITEGQTRKYEKKLEDLRVSYEKLIRNVRNEERDSYHREMSKLIEANKELQQENERLRGELFDYKQEELIILQKHDELAARALSERKTSRKRSKSGHAQQTSNHKNQKVSRQNNSSPASHRIKTSSRQKIQTFKTQRPSQYDIIKGEASIVTTALTPKKNQSSSKTRPQSSRFKLNNGHSKSKEKNRLQHHHQDQGIKQRSSLKQSSSAQKGSARSASNNGLSRTALQQQIASQMLNPDIQIRTSRFNEAMFTDSDF